MAGINFDSFLTPDMASKPMPGLASFYNAMPGIKELSSIVSAINYKKSGFKPFS